MRMLRPMAIILFVLSGCQTPPAAVEESTELSADISNDTGAQNKAGVRDFLSIPGPLNFAGQTYRFAWSSHPSPQLYKHEYLADGQTPQRYRQMLMIDLIQDAGDVKQLAGSQVRKLKERKASDPVVNMDIATNDKTGEIYLDFVLSDRDKAGEFIIEWNAYRYLPHQAADGTSGVMLFAISERAYGHDEVDTFLANLKSRRSKIINALYRYDVPTAVP